MKGSGKSGGMKNCRPAKAYAEGGKVEKTTRMPSGAQQYVRGGDASSKMKTIIKNLPSVPKGGDAEKIRDYSRKRSGMHRAFMDEVNAADRAYGDKGRR